MGIKNALSCKKPALWIIIAAAVTAAVLAICFITADPKTDEPSGSLDTGPATTGYMVITKTGAGETKCFDIINDGRLTEMSVPDTLSAYSIAAEGCFARENGKNKLIKTELVTSSGEKVKALSNAEKNIFSAAAKAEEEVTGLKIFRETLLTDRYCAAVEFFNSEKPHTDVFTFDVNKKELSKLCSVTEGEVCGVSLGPVGRIVAEALLAPSDNYSEYECFTEGHLILGTETSGSTSKIYILCSAFAYGFENGCLISESGHSLPAVIQYKNSGEDVELIEPEDGSKYGDSIKKMFPAKYHRRILGDQYTDASFIGDQCDSQAAAYLESIGRNERVCSYGDIEHILFCDIGMPVEVENNFVLPEGFPFQLGSREKVEDGVRYIYKCEQGDAGTLVCTKTEYETGKERMRLVYALKSGKLLSSYGYPVKK